MRILATTLLLIAAATQVFARDVRVLIAPRSVSVPRSGKLVFDVYWINRGSRPASIPGAGLYSFVYTPLDVEAGWGGTNARIFSHSPPNRQIAPGAIVRDTATADLETRGAKLLEVTGHFRGRRVEFESNSVLVHASR